VAEKSSDLVVETDKLTKIYQNRQIALNDSGQEGPHEERGGTTELDGGDVLEHSIEVREQQPDCCAKARK